MFALVRVPAPAPVRGDTPGLFLISYLTFAALIPMLLTPEQQAILQTTGNIRINAVAGSGKTTTLIAYAKSRPENSRILYLAFNKTVKLEAVKKFAEQGLSQVQVETAHSLAYRHIVFRHGYQVRSRGYSTHELVALLGISGDGNKHTEYILANHINQLIAMFCNSSAAKVQELDYLSTLPAGEAKAFAESHLDAIVHYARILLAKMDRGEIAITHDFYLKKFQLAQPQLPYDYVLFDEAQDASPAMLDIVLKQRATQVIVGDTHQQIYSWRFAINSLEQVEYPSYPLTTSFRFNTDIADLAMRVLEYKTMIDKNDSTIVVGKGGGKRVKLKAFIARTNLGLLLQAIEYVQFNKSVKHIYFEGNIHSYTYADEGTSLYDVMNLSTVNRDRIKDPLIKSMQTLDDLEDYIEKTEDLQLGMMVEIVKEYGTSIPQILQTIKEKHVANEEKDKAEVIFSTVHRCKGMEYDVVQLVDDFISEKKLQQLIERSKQDNELTKLNEEINLLYVAVTRTRNILLLPENLVPSGLTRSPQIHILRNIAQDAKERAKVVGKQPASSSRWQKEPQPSRWLREPQPPESRSGKASSRWLREPQPPRTSSPTQNIPTSSSWTPDQDQTLTAMFIEGASLEAMMHYFDRTRGAIGSRIKKLQLEKRYGSGRHYS